MEQYGRWTVLERYPRDERKRYMALCKCECGTERVVDYQQVRAGSSKSCGCLNREKSSARHKTHGLTKSPIYSVWKNMKRRCTNPDAKDFYLYGGRGISVCERWMDFNNFYADMGDIPFKSAQLDRIDSDGNYEPSNCKWSSPSEQMRNRRDNRMIEHNGEYLCLTDWESKAGFPRNMLYSRLKNGWSFDKAINTPPRVRSVML